MTRQMASQIKDITKGRKEDNIEDEGTATYV